MPLSLALATLNEVEQGDDTLRPGKTPKVSRQLVMEVFAEAQQVAGDNKKLQALFDRVHRADRGCRGKRGTSMSGAYDVAVVGAGPVGCVTALAFAKRGASRCCCWKRIRKPASVWLASGCIRQPSRFSRISMYRWTAWVVLTVRAASRCIPMMAASRWYCPTATATV